MTASRFWLIASNHTGEPGRLDGSKPAKSPACHSPIAAPAGSIATPIEPASPTGMAGTTTPPPVVSTARAAASMSVTVR